MRYTFWIIIIFVTLGTAARADSIRLKSSVRVAEGQSEIKLRDVATLDGPATQPLADVVVFYLDDAESPATLDVADVRRALRDENVNWGRITLNGRQCVIRPTGPRSTTLGDRNEPVEDAAETTVWAGQLIEEPTLRGRIAHVLSHDWFRMSPADVELLFDVDDDAALNLSTTEYEFEVASTATPHSRRLPIQVHVFKQDQVIQTIRLTVQVRLRQDVLVVRQYLNRNDRFGADDVVRETRLLTPHPSQVVPPQTVLKGLEARKRLVPGQILRAGDIGLPIAIERNQIVTVRSRHGSVVLRMDVRAVESGRVGDVIRVRHLMDRLEFMARIEDHGELVALGGTPEGGGS